MTTVALVDLGENLSIDLSKLSEKLNSLQSTWLFEVVDAQPNIGDPDDEDIWYRVDRLWLELDRHCPTEGFDVVIGLTHVRLTNQNPALGAIERDYFSLSDWNRLAVITEAMQQWNSQDKDLYQYFSYLIVGELLTVMAKIDLFHQSKDLCLFDDCADRSEFAKGIQRGKICSRSKLALQNAHVPDGAVKDALRVLKWTNQPGARPAICAILNPGFPRNLINHRRGAKSRIAQIAGLAPMLVPLHVVRGLVPGVRGLTPGFMPPAAPRTQ